MDRAKGDTFTFRFTTRQFSDGVPTALSGGVLSAMEGAVDTAITTGVSFTSSSVAGLNLCTIDSSQADFESGKEYDVYISTGTVGGVSVIGEVVGHFSLRREAAAVDLVNGTDGLGALKALIDTVNTDLSNGTDGLGALKTLIDTVNTDLSNGTDGLGALKILIDDKTGYSLSTAGILAVWHQALTAVVTPGSVGKLLKDEITSVRMATLTDLIDGGRLDTILDELTTQGDTNEAKIDTVDTVADGIQTDLDNATDGLGALKALIDALNDTSVSDILTTVLTESYAADGSTATLSQLLYMIWSVINSLKFVSTTGTSRKLDGTTTAMTFTLDDADDPTDINRAT